MEEAEEFPVETEKKVELVKDNDSDVFEDVEYEYRRSIPSESASTTSSERWLFQRRLFLNFEVLRPGQHKVGLHEIHCQTRQNYPFLLD